MNATIAPIYPVSTRRTRRAAAPVAAAPATPVQTRTLPMRAGVGVAVSAPNWLWILGGGVLGTFLLGPIGGIAGAVAGYMLTR
ncbi:MAG: hypothetical protein JWL76_732 [Thermoleophilia bacterium]|nr:hypothetical protein [Thermoleophilia bacterium]